MPRGQCKCQFCGYEFETFSRVESEYYEYGEYIDVTKYYPVPSENAHMMGSYVCDKCYRKYSQIIKSKMEKRLSEYLDCVDGMKAQAYEKYLKELKSIEDKAKQVQNAFDGLKSVTNMLDLPNGLLEDFKKDSIPCFTVTNSDLIRAIEWEKTHLLNQKPIVEWAKENEIEIEELPESMSESDWVTEEEFYKILIDCKIKNKSVKEIMQIIDSYKK